MSRIRPFVLIPAALLTAFAVFAGLALSEPGDAPGRKYALVVGVKSYPQGEGLGDLKHTEDDADALAAVLTDKCGFRRVVVMTQAKGAAKADLLPTADNIQDNLKSLLEDCKRGDTVLVAFSGHGIQLKVDGRDEAFFCPMDARPSKRKNLVALSDVYKQMDGSIADVKLLLADCCRNDAEGKGAGGDNLAPPEPPRGVAALFSCSKGQRSFESEEFKQGIFFHYVIEGLKGQAANKKGEVTLASLADYVQDEVPDRVKKETSPLVRQVPNLVGDVSGKLMLAKADAGGPSTPDTPVVETAEKEETFDYLIGGETKHGTRRVLTVDLGGGVKMEFVRIPQGTFQMGSPDSDKDASEYEKPRHEVEISTFYMAKTLVTKKQFGRFAKGYKTEAETDGKGGDGWDGKTFTQDPKYSWRDAGFAQSEDHPAVNVTWKDAEAFCDWASGVTKRRVVLPREAEWEYACRGGTTTRYFTGDAAESLEGSANIADWSTKKQFPDWTIIDFDDGYVFTSPVGKFKANPFGLYDMTGNAWEWCADYYDPKYYSNSDKKDPENTTKSDARVVRGGSWYFASWGARAACRSMYTPASRNCTIGFRLALRLD